MNINSTLPRVLFSQGSDFDTRSDETVKITTGLNKFNYSNHPNGSSDPETYKYLEGVYTENPKAFKTAINEEINPGRVRAMALFLFEKIESLES